MITYKSRMYSVPPKYIGKQLQDYDNQIHLYYNPDLIKCHDLIAQLKKAKLENRLKHFTSYTLLIIDEWGYLPIEKEDSKLFFQLIDQTNTRRKVP